MTFPVPAETVVRGGWGRFYYHSGQFTSGLDASAGVAQANQSPSNWVGGPGCPTNPSTGSALLTAYLIVHKPGFEPGFAVCGGRQRRQTTLYRRLERQRRPGYPWQGLFELSYVGNRSEDGQNTQGGVSTILTWFPAGSMFSATNPATANANNYRPLQGYGDLVLATNDIYQNYNAMQVSWARHAGKYVIQANYTFQKALGIISPVIDPFSLKANYGALGTNRTNLFQRSLLV